MERVITYRYLMIQKAKSMMLKKARRLLKRLTEIREETLV